MIDIPKKKKARTLSNKVGWANIQLFNLCNKLVALQIDAKVNGLSVEVLESIDELIITIKALLEQAKKLRGLANDHTILYR